MMSLGLDISQKSTGWAVLKDGSLVDYGWFSFDKEKKLSDNFILFDSYLESIISKYKDIKYVCIEDTFFGKNIKTLKLLTRYSSIAMLICRKLIPSITILLLPIASIRSALFPERKVDKEEIYRYICSEYKLVNVPDDVTDAIAVAKFVFTRKILNRKWIV